MNRIASPILAALTIGAGIILTGAPAHADADPQVVYTVTSDDSLSTVTYFDGLNNLDQVSDTAAPWSLSLANTATYPEIGVGAQTDGTSVTCEIRVNGRVVDTKTATGRYAVVNCTAPM